VSVSCVSKGKVHMTHNRMWLRCKVCHKIDIGRDGKGDINPYIWLGETVGNEWYMSNINQTQEQLALHAGCRYGFFDNNLFDLVYEAHMPPDQWARAIRL
jgi:hypothetical protein